MVNIVKLLAAISLNYSFLTPQSKKIPYALGSFYLYSNFYKSSKISDKDFGNSKALYSSLTFISATKAYIKFFGETASLANLLLFNRWAVKDKSWYEIISKAYSLDNIIEIALLQTCGIKPKDVFNFGSYLFPKVVYNYLGSLGNMGLNTKKTIDQSYKISSAVYPYLKPLIKSLFGESEKKYSFFTLGNKAFPTEAFEVISKLIEFVPSIEEDWVDVHSEFNLNFDVNSPEWVVISHHQEEEIYSFTEIAKALYDLLNRGDKTLGEVFQFVKIESKLIGNLLLTSSMSFAVMKLISNLIDADRNINSDIIMSLEVISIDEPGIDNSSNKKFSFYLNDITSDILYCQNYESPFKDGCLENESGYFLWCA